MGEVEIDNAFLINATKDIKDIGLMHGKMGICLYFYLLGRKVNNKEYTEYADSLLDDIYETVNKHSLTNFETGLAGIGWGITYLAQHHFIEANLDEVLIELDNSILKAVTGNSQVEIGLTNGLAGYLCYLVQRLSVRSCIEESLSYELNKELLISVINNMEQSFCKLTSVMSKDISFDLFGSLPVMIYTLRQAYDLNIYNNKIEKLINQQLLYMETNFPSLNVNRLYLACELKYLSTSIPMKRIDRLVEILLFSIDFSSLLYEVGSITGIRCGLAGFKLLLYRFLQILPPSSPYYDNIESIFKNIPNINEELSKDAHPVSLSRSLGLAEGVAGVKLIKIFQ